MDKKHWKRWKIGRLMVFCGIIALMIIQGCQHDPELDPDPDPDQDKDQENPYQEVNDWILDNLETFYYWNTQMTPNISPKLKPDEYFNALLFKDDRFSWIQDNFQELMASLMGVNTEAGYDFDLLRLSENSSDVIGYITYTKPGTPAEAAGLKHGDYFLEINNTQLTIDNYRTLIQEMSNPHTLGLVDIEGNRISGITHIPLSVIVYKENPILLDTIYQIQGKKIGYFVYNFFANDSEEYGITYEKELNNLFLKFKTEGIDELIVDLRYNSGGTTNTAMVLASMIANRSSADIFGFMEFNAILDTYYRRTYGANYNVDYFPDYIERTDPNNRVVEQVAIHKLAGLTRVYMIVSDRTASASELLINGIRPYMGDHNVVLVGWSTTGKNVGSFTIYEDDPVKQKTNNWGMQPIVCKLSNSQQNSNYENGFTPDVQIHETQVLLMKQLGETNELLLATTLDLIFGTTTVRRKVINEKATTVGSSIDLHPARQQMNIDLSRKLKQK